MSMSITPASPATSNSVARSHPLIGGACRKIRSRGAGPPGVFHFRRRSVGDFYIGQLALQNGLLTPLLIGCQFDPTRAIVTPTETNRTGTPNEREKAGNAQASGRKPWQTAYRSAGSRGLGRAVHPRTSPGRCSRLYRGDQVFDAAWRLLGIGQFFACGLRDGLGHPQTGRT